MRAVAGQTRDELYATRAVLEAQIGALGDRMREAEAADDRQLDAISALSAETTVLATALQDAETRAAGRHMQVVDGLRFNHDRDPASRRRLRQLRHDPTYESPFREDSPLVSVVIPTYSNYRLLGERSIPSVLAQTHQNFEIVVVGDDAPDEAQIVVEGFGDPRISYANRSYRGPYPDHPDARWLVAGVPPYNDAVQRSRGLWIAPLDDDDAFAPTHLERLLELAQAGRHELVYSQITVHSPNGETTTIGRFPPEHAQFALQSSLYHVGLADIFELELADAAFGLPYDWALCRRMMQSGVRMAMLDVPTVEYFPSRVWTDRQAAQETQPPEVPEWEYVPEGWGPSAAAPATGWDAVAVARSYQDKWAEFIAVTDGPGPLGVGHEVPLGVPMMRTDLAAQSMVLVFAFALARAAGGRGVVSVLDWGGALGHHYHLARRLLPDLELEYHCRELPEVCAEGRRVLPEVRFHDTDDCLSERYDLVFASSSIQYEHDWRGRLGSLARACREWMLVTRVPLTATHQSFVLRQRAGAYGYGTEYLGWVLNHDELLAAAADAALTLDREFVLTPEWRVPGAPAAVTHGGFLFHGNGAGR